MKDTLWEKILSLTPEQRKEVEETVDNIIEFAAERAVWLKKHGEESTGGFVSNKRVYIVNNVVRPGFTLWNNDDE